MKALLELKTKYKAESGQEWTPKLIESVQLSKPTTAQPTSPSTTASSNPDPNQLLRQIKDIGDAIRSLKEKKAGKVGF